MPPTEITDLRTPYARHYTTGQPGLIRLVCRSKPTPHRLLTGAPYLGTTSDGHIYGEDVVFANARATAAEGVTAEQFINIGLSIDGSTYYPNRGYLTFDTSAIPDDATVASADLYACADTVLWMGQPDNHFLIQCYRYAWVEPLGQADNYQANYAGAYGGSATLEGTWRNTASGWVDGAYYSCALDPAGVNKTGASKYALVSKNDVDNIANTGNDCVSIRSADYAGTGSDPYLEILYWYPAPVKVYHYRPRRT